ncbi:MAG: choline/glycine/proline betaine transport protein [Cognaticolwellia sp.]|jgi:choline/glycine/proline betaine transport protein
MKVTLLKRQKMSNKKNKYFDIHAPVFYPASIIIVLFIVLTLVIGKPMEQVFANIQSQITTNAGWLLVLVVNMFLALALYFSISKIGKIRLGGKDAEPEFSTFGWFSMLFSAGLGVGLLFYGVGEPMMHFSNDVINETPGTAEAAKNAMKYTFLHYGLHAWAVYAVLGVALAFFAFNKGLPLTLRSVFYPILGDKINGWIGDLIDTIAVVATLFGLATSLGLGVGQVSAGLNYLFGTNDTIAFQVFLIAVITGGATVSVVLGLDKGVRVLSELNMRLAIVFLVLMLLLGPTVYLLDGFIQNVGVYFQNMIELGVLTEVYQGTTWQHDWTIFYWAWWIAWSPFVAMFIARVSKGRTIREFFLGVMLVPSLLTFLWMSVFGGSGIYLELQQGINISDAVNENISTALFVMLEEYPWSTLMSVLGIILVTSFFITSSDSGSLVIDSITAGGKLDAPVGQRIFWAFVEGTVAATLLLGGGLKALQTASIASGLPFAIILIIMCFSLVKGLHEEVRAMEKAEKVKERTTYQNIITDLVNKRKTK